MTRPRLSDILLRQDQPQPVTEVNIIPVIDISLVLLVILFVTAPLLSVPSLPVELPRSSAPPSEEPFISLTYTREEVLSLGASPSNWEVLPAALADEIKRRPEATVLLRVEKTVPYRVVARLLDAAKKAGASKIALGTDPFK